MSTMFPNSFIILFFLGWYAQRNLGIGFKAGGMTREYIFSLVSAYICLAAFVAGIFLKINK